MDEGTERRQASEGDVVVDRGVERWLRGASARGTCEEITREQAEEEDAARRLTEDETVAASTRKAEGHRMMHEAYMQEYVSVMRVRFSWAIFSMIWIWLLALLYLVGASASGCVNIRLFALALGMILGYVVGTLWGHACRNKRNRKDLKQAYRCPWRERVELIDRNIQLRVMRSGGSVPCVVLCVFFGGAIGYTLSSFFAEGQLAPSFKLSDAVILTLIGTTTGTVISLFAIVLHWLFPGKEERVRHRKYKICKAGKWGRGKRGGRKGGARRKREVPGGKGGRGTTVGGREEAKYGVRSMEVRRNGVARNLAAKPGRVRMW